MLSEPELLAACQRHDPRAQRLLYEKYASQMLAVCKRYVRDADDAEDVLAEGFVKVFRYLHQFEGRGALGAWIRRVMAHEALRFLRRRGPLTTQLEDDFVARTAVEPAAAEHDLAAADLWRLLDTLPAGYRAVFNLYAVEGFSHPQIAEVLGISEGTSKSQLFKARAMLQKRINALQAVAVAA